MRTQIHFLWQALIATCLLADLRSIAQNASIIRIGPDSADSPSVATAISDDGQVVYGVAGRFRETFIDGRAFKWQESTGIVMLASPGAPEDETLVYATSADGSRAVGSAGSRIRPSPAWWSPDGPRFLPMLEGAAGDYGTAFEISSDGRVILGTGVTPGNSYRYILRWVDGGPPVKLSGIGPWAYGSRPRLSADGAVAAFDDGNLVQRWSPGIGLVPMRISPSYPDTYPGISRIALSDDGQILAGTPAFEFGGAGAGRIFTWQGLTDGTPIPARVAEARSFSELIMNGSGSLLAGASAPGTNGQAWLIPTYGILPFDQVLKSQGADITPWASITNLNAMSSDGRWIVGSGIRGGDAPEAGVRQGFRAHLTMNGTGEPQLKFSMLPSGIVQLRWPATDVLVAVESVPMLNPAVPWQPESGWPVLQGSEIVLDLYALPQSRIYRLRRLH